MTWIRRDDTIVLLSCIHVTVGAGSPSMSQENRAVSPSATVTDCGLVRILAGREGFSLGTESCSRAESVEDVFSLSSDVACFPVKENFSEEYEELEERYSVEAYLIDESYLSAEESRSPEENLSAEAPILSRVITSRVSVSFDLLSSTSR